MLDPIKTAPPKRFKVFTTIQILEAAYVCLQAEFGELADNSYLPGAPATNWHGDVAVGFR